MCHSLRVYTRSCQSLLSSIAQLAFKKRNIRPQQAYIRMLTVSRSMCRAQSGTSAQISARARERERECVCVSEREGESRSVCSERLDELAAFSFFLSFFFGVK